MDSKHIKVDKNQQIAKDITPICLLVCYFFVFCIFLTIALCPVPPGFARTAHIYKN